MVEDGKEQRHVETAYPPLVEVGDAEKQEFHVRLQEMLDDVKLLASRSVGIDREHVGGAPPLRLEREETLVAPYVEDGFPSQVLGKLNPPQPFLALYGSRCVHLVGQADSLIPFETLQQVTQIGRVHSPPRCPVRRHGA